MNVAGTANITGNVIAPYFLGNGSQLSGISVSSSSISNGNSNVNIATANGNITLSAVGNANIVVVTGTGANITGTANITGNVIAPYFLGNGSQLTGLGFAGGVSNGTSNLAIPDTNGNVLVSVSGTANVIAFSNTSMNVAGTANITGNLVVQGSNFTIGSGTGGNIAGANAITSNSYTANGSVTGNSNVSTVTGVLGIRSIASTYTDNAATASATIANAAIHSFGIPTLAATNATVTFTNAATFYIPAGPTAGTNATITNSYSLMTAGNVRFFGNLRITGQGGLGYNATIGSATQATSRNTAVTISNVTGAITLFSATTTANTINVFTVTNTTVAAADTIILNQRTGNTSAYIITVSNVAAGSFQVQIFNYLAVTESPILNFAVIKTA